MNDAILKLRGREVSWVGYCPWNDRPCYGTEDGSVVLPLDWPNFGSMSRGDLHFKVFDEESVNGVAFTDDLMAVSCRSEVSVFQRNSTDAPDSRSLKLERFALPFSGGAHGIIALADGGFVAPLGGDGLLFMRREVTNGSWQISKIPDERINFYRIISLGHTLEGEVLIAATRSTGIVAMTLQHGFVKPPVIAHRAPGIDIIDVCSLGSEAAPRAVIGLNRDGRLLWSRDVLDPRPSSMISLDGLAGKKYSIFSSGGHVFIITSTKLLTLPNLARRLLDGHNSRRPQLVMRLAVEAADAYLLPDDRFYVVEEDQVPIFSLRKIIEQAAQGQLIWGAQVGGDPDWSIGFSTASEVGLQDHFGLSELNLSASEAKVFDSNWSSQVLSFDRMIGT